MKQLLVSFFSLVLFIPLFGQADVDIIDLKIVYNNSPSQYEVYMKSDNNVFPALMGSSQITVVFPDSITNGILDNMNITSVFPLDWSQNTTLLDLGSTYPNYPYDYYAVATQGAQYMPGVGITAGEEILLFTFTVDGDCIEGTRLFDRFIDPLSHPDTTNGLDFEHNIALQTSGGPVEAYDYLYGDLVPPCTVPVEYLSFEARKGKGQVDLTWVTATEINNDFYDVQRSFDGKDFRTIGQVDGKGTTFSTSNYEYIDSAPLEANYYRLRQVDFDGTESFSDIKFIAFDNGNEDESKYEVYPNPFINELTIDLGTNDLYTVSVFDASGQTVYNKAYVSGNTLNMNQLAAGTYTLKVYNSVGTEILVKTIVKVARS